jgi:hypothetical protein
MAVVSYDYGTLAISGFVCFLTMPSSFRQRIFGSAKYIITNYKAISMSAGDAHRTGTYIYLIMRTDAP